MVTGWRHIPWTLLYVNNSESLCASIASLLHFIHFPSACFLGILEWVINCGCEEVLGLNWNRLDISLCTAHVLVHGGCSWDRDNAVMLRTLSDPLVMLMWHGKQCCSRENACAHTHLHTHTCTNTQCLVRQGRYKETGATWPDSNQTTVTAATPAGIRTESVSALPQGDNASSWNINTYVPYHCEWRTGFLGVFFVTIENAIMWSVSTNDSSNILRKGTRFLFTDIMHLWGEETVPKI